jgi:Flp pilus assembly protein TadD
MRPSEQVLAKAIEHQRAGRLEAALALKPDYAQDPNNLGAVLEQMGRWEEAAAGYQGGCAGSPVSSRRT